MKLLFIGNSATYVHQIPQTLQHLLQLRGIDAQITQCTKGGYELHRHADLTTEHGRLVQREIQKQHDVVFLQDNGNCITSPEKQDAARLACRNLITEIRQSGATPMLYVRPPYGKLLGELSPLEQCAKLDELFGDISAELDTKCVFVNRAFAKAIQVTQIPMWGPDNAHTSPEGAYLAACTFYKALLGESPRGIDPCGIDPAVAARLQEIADTAT